MPVEQFTLIYRESGTRLTIGAGPGTLEKKRDVEHNLPFGFFGWKFWTTSQDVPFIFAIFRSG